MLALETVVELAVQGAKPHRFGHHETSPKRSIVKSRVFGQGEKVRMWDKEQGMYVYHPHQMS